MWKFLLVLLLLIDVGIPINALEYIILIPDKPRQGNVLPSPDHEIGYSWSILPNVRILQLSEISTYIPGDISKAVIMTHGHNNIMCRTADISILWPLLSKYNQVYIIACDQNNYESHEKSLFNIRSGLTDALKVPKHPLQRPYLTYPLSTCVQLNDQDTYVLKTGKGLNSLCKSLANPKPNVQITEPEVNNIMAHYNAIVIEFRKRIKFLSNAVVNIIMEPPPNTIDVNTYVVGNDQYAKLYSTPTHQTWYRCGVREQPFPEWSPKYEQFDAAPYNSNNWKPNPAPLTDQQRLTNARADANRQLYTQILNKKDTLPNNEQKAIYPDITELIPLSNAINSNFNQVPDRYRVLSVTALITIQQQFKTRAHTRTHKRQHKHTQTHLTNQP